MLPGQDFCFVFSMMKGRRGRNENLNFEDIKNVISMRYNLKKLATPVGEE